MKMPGKSFLAAAGLLLSAALAGCRSTAPAPPTAPAAEPLAAKPAAEAHEDEAYRQMRLLTKAMMQIRHSYVNDSKIGYQDLARGALRGMLQSLDPYSQYLDPKDYEDMQDDTAGEYGGLGIRIGLIDDQLTVITPMEDTPAFRAGIMPGDRIVEIDGTSTEKMSLREAVGKLKGEKGTKVVLKARRTGQKDPLVFEIIRDTIRVASVKGARMLDGQIGYVRITQFSEPTASALQGAADKLHAQGMKALVLDLRSNPGGLLSSAVEVCDLFLHPGDRIVTTRGRHGILQQQRVSAFSRRRRPDFPIAILINGHTASAAEIVAGALQDHKRAILIGETTYGKASVQSIFAQEDGSAIRLTTAKYYTPNEREIHEKGIEPDIAAPLTAEEWQKVQQKRARQEEPGAFSDLKRDDSSLENVTDRQLERAADLLKGILVFRAKE